MCIRDKNVALLSVFSVSLCLLASFGQAQPYYDWQNEYNGTTEATIGLWHFNQTDVYTSGSNTYASVLPDKSASEWDAYYNTSTSTCSFAAGGKFGWGLHTNGGATASDRADVYNGTNVFPAGNDPNLSIECWVKFNNSTSRQFLISKGTAWSSIGGYDLWYDNGVLKFAVSDGSASKQTTATWTPVVGTWYHIAATWNAKDDTARLYVNGAMVGSNTFAGLSIVNDASRKLALGGRCVSTHTALNGVIDEVRISSVACDYATQPQPPNFSPGHPRLFFTANDWADLEARRWTTHSDEWSQMIAKCNSLQGTMPTTTPRTASGLFDYEERLVDLAFVQMIDPSLPYQQTSENWFWTILNWTEWGAGYWSWPDYGPRGNLETGECLKALAVWYDLQYHNLTQAQRNEVSQKLADYAHRYRNSYPNFWTTKNGELTGNHCWNAFTALAAVLYGADNISSDRIQNWTNLLDGHYNTIANLMNNEFSDGVTGEGATYWTYGIEKVLSWFEMRRMAGKPAFTGLPWFENTGTYGMYISLPGGNDNFGGNCKFDDANPDYWGNPYNDLPLLAKATQDPAAQWMTTQINHSGSGKKDAYRYIFYDPNIPAVNPDTDLSNWKFFDDYGFFIWRSSWANNASHFSIRSGQHSHGHSKGDDGQFMIHRAGIPYIINLGYAVPRWTKDGNVLLIDNTGQYSDGDDWGAVFNESWPNNQDTWGETLLVLANGGKAHPGNFFDVLIEPTQMYTNSKLSQWRREAVNIGGDLYLIRDTVSASSSANFDLLLHASVTATGGNAYDEDTYSTSNPWTVLGAGRWKIDARNETPQPANMLVQDLSKNSWSGSILPSYYYSKYDGYVQLGYNLTRSLSGTSGTSLMSFGFDDFMAGWTLAAWNNSAAEGVHVTSAGSDVIDVLWPVNGISCINSDGWTVTGKMAGRRYDANSKAAYFGRDVTLITDNATTLLTATQPVSFHAQLENDFGSLQNSVVISAAAGAAVTFYSPRQPHSVLFNGLRLDYTWQNNELTVTIPACESAVLTVRTGPYLYGDINGDKIVNMLDLAMLAENWEKSEPNPNTDIYEDGAVDFLDLWILAENWLYQTII